MREYRSFALVVLAIFVMKILGAYFCHTFLEQKTYLELFLFFGAILFVVSTLGIIAYLGFNSFALYIAIFLAAFFGVLSAVIVVLSTYIAWGSVFAMEVLLYDAGAKSAKEWFMRRYKFKTFKAEYYTFYPLLGFVYILLEVLPNIFKRESVIDFSPSRVLKEMEELLD